MTYTHFVTSRGKAGRCVRKVAAVGLLLGCVSAAQAQEAASADSPTGGPIVVDGMREKTSGRRSPIMFGL